MPIGEVMLRPRGTTLDGWNHKCSDGGARRIGVDDLSPQSLLAAESCFRGGFDLETDIHHRIRWNADGANEY